MITRQPLWIEEGGIAVNAGQGLVNVDDPTFKIGRIHGHMDLTSKGPILGRRNRQRSRNHTWACARGDSRERSCQSANGHRHDSSFHAIPHCFASQPCSAKNIAPTPKKNNAKSKRGPPVQMFLTQNAVCYFFFSSASISSISRFMRAASAW
jgi:hypothetical protein